MKDYIIKIKNDGGYVIDDILVRAQDENKAMIKLLKEDTLASGDTITIQESENEKEDEIKYIIKNRVLT